MFEYIFVYAEFARPAKVDGNVRADNPLDFPDAVIDWVRAIVDELTCTQVFPLPGAPMEGRNHWQQIEAI
jgi:hypothetical protein